MLKELCTFDAVSGRETALRQRILAEITAFCDEVKTDAIGNLIAVKSGKNNAPSVLLTVPMDECGLLISNIEKDGFLRFDAIGNLAVSTLPAKPVRIGAVGGVIGQKAVHLTAKEEREKELSLSSLYIDIGAASEEEAAECVTVGDAAVLDIGFSSFGNGFAKGRALGERMACCIAIALLKQPFDVNLTVLFAAQHQIGGRGLKAAMHQKSYDVGIMIDGTMAALTGEGVQCGKGVALHHGSSPELMKIMDGISKEKEISMQRTPEGSDVLGTYVKNFMQHVSLQIPVRYRDAAVQVASVPDMENTEALLCALLEQIKRGEGR